MNAFSNIVVGIGIVALLAALEVPTFEPRWWVSMIALNILFGVKRNY